MVAQGRVGHGCAWQLVVIGLVFFVSIAGIVIMPMTAWLGFESKFSEVGILVLTPLH